MGFMKEKLWYLPIIDLKVTFSFTMSLLISKLTFYRGIPSIIIGWEFSSQVHSLFLAIRLSGFLIEETKLTQKSRNFPNIDLTYGWIKSSGRALDQGS